MDVVQNVFSFNPRKIMDGDRLSPTIHSISQWLEQCWRNGVLRQLGPSTPATAVSRTISHLVLRASPEETNDLSHVIDHLPMGHLSFLSLLRPHPSLQRNRGTIY
ncbi:hypothetical protein HNY73_000839 [Argiope bruennichi]|uniref:Uncharacterized protein n=1 Tax=Argiope bruennichi TaxID=94029 RepID=A0A8T0G3N2_ARGBR|nr:hypothetical protein HNY73_000839 [Argiope bruennichi]